MHNLDVQMLSTGTKLEIKERKNLIRIRPMISEEIIKAYWIRLLLSAADLADVSNQEKCKFWRTGQSELSP